MFGKAKIKNAYFFKQNCVYAQEDVPQSFEKIF